MKITSIEKYAAKIDPKGEAYTEIKTSQMSLDFDHYITALINHLTNTSISGSFDFDSEHTEIRSQVSKLATSANFREAAQVVAARLLRIESDVREAYQARLIHEIPKSVLLISLLEIDIDGVVERKILIAKIDHSDFLGGTNLSLRTGISLKKRIVKAFLCKVSPRGATISDVEIYDSQQSIASYWWKSFLELQQLVTDDKNTEKAFQTIDNKILLQVKNISQPDYTVLRNSTIKYFRTKSKFDLGEFRVEVLESYSPISPEISMSDLSQELARLADKKRTFFDPQFNIAKEKITAKIVRVIELTPQIELRLKDHIENLPNVIEPGEDRDGRKHIKVYSDAGYAIFKGIK